MSRPVRISTGSRRGRRLLPALAVAAGLVLAGCGGGASAGGDAAGGSAGGSAGGHDHSAGEAPATLSGSADRYAGLDLVEPYRRPTFTLTDTTGASYDFRTQTEGKPTLLFFGYTNCPDVCPTTMADVALALRQLDPAVAEQVTVVFVTTDPAFDTPEVLGEYLGRFDADLPRPFVGLTGSQDLVDQAQLAAGVPLAEDQGRLHSSLLLLYGPDDAARVAFDAGNTARDIGHDLAAVVAEQ